MVRAALLRRSCDGVAAATELLLRRICADQLRRAHSARRVRDGADAARSAAATELRRSRCCDGAAQTSSVALILRIASRRDALNDEPASFSPGLIQISMVVAHSPRPPTWPRNYSVLHLVNQVYYSPLYFPGVPLHGRPSSPGHEGMHLERVRVAKEINGYSVRLTSSHETCA